MAKFKRFSTSIPPNGEKLLIVGRTGGFTETFIGELYDGVIVESMTNDNSIFSLDECEWVLLKDVVSGIDPAGKIKSGHVILCGNCHSALPLKNKKEIIKCPYCSEIIILKFVGDVVEVSPYESTMPPKGVYELKFEWAKSAEFGGWVYGLRQGETVYGVVAIVEHTNNFAWVTSSGGWQTVSGKCDSLQSAQVAAERTMNEYGSYNIVRRMVKIELENGHG